MQFIAKDDHQLIHVSFAENGKNYFCLECNTPVRLKKPTHRHPHFYHLSSSIVCRQDQKSQEHLQLQLKLLSLLGEETAEMEYLFEGIHRIADVVCHKRKIIFEIQCCWVSYQEVSERIRGYNEVGYHVIWILHDKKFNKNHQTAVEAYLKNRHCYYTNINAKAEGIVYDQFEIIQNSRRVFKGPKLCINIQNIHSINIPAHEEDLPQIIKVRSQKWKLFISGDLYDRFLKSSKKEISNCYMIELENRYLNPSRGIKKFNLKAVALCYYQLALDYFS